MLGFNEPDLLIRRHVLGETIPDRPRYRHGTVLRGLKEILVAG
jgi:carbamoyl-phosphate synthase large subunit